MKLPRKAEHQELAGGWGFQERALTLNEVLKTTNEIIDYLAELTEVVEGKRVTLTPVTTKLRSVEEIVKEFESKVLDSTLTAVDYGCNGMSEECCGSCGGEYISEFEVTKWFRTTLTTDRAHIAAILIEGLEGIAVGTDQRGRHWIELPDAITLIKATLDVTNEEK